MTRAELKNKLGDFRPSLIRPEMLETASERKLMRLEESPFMRYEKEKLAIYNMKDLTNERRRDLWCAASERRWTASEKLRGLRRLCDRMRERRMLKLMKRPIASRRVRAAA